MKKLKIKRSRSEEQVRGSEFVTTFELARIANITYGTVKHYINMDLLPYEQSEPGKTKYLYRAECLQRIEMIQRLKKEGKTLAQISETLKSHKSIDSQIISKNSSNGEKRNQKSAKPDPKSIYSLSKPNNKFLL